MEVGKIQERLQTIRKSVLFRVNFRNGIPICTHCQVHEIGIVIWDRGMSRASQAVFKAGPTAAKLEAFCATEVEIRQARKGVCD